VTKKSWKSYGANISSSPDICFYCSKKIDSYERTVDHIIPQSRGGILSNNNKLHSCGDCNKLKADMTPEEFKRALSSMIRLLGKDYKRQIGYLKRIAKNVDKIIESKKR
tara:strand:- start:4214 stop:4540 length:327 start_codon:yes stop_codon:yes gene_type:complete